MNSRVQVMTLICAGLCMADATAAGHAHVHGVARIDIAIEAKQVSLHLETPMANVLGFEHAPRTAAERAQARAALEQLQTGARWWRIDPAAQCVVSQVQIDADALRQTDAAKTGAQAPDEHADIDADYVFTCADAARAATIEVGVFKDWPHLHRIDVQVAGPRGQFKRTLDPAHDRLELQ